MHTKHSILESADKGTLLIKERKEPVNIHRKDSGIMVQFKFKAKTLKDKKSYL